MKEVTWMKEGLLTVGTPETSEGEAEGPQGAAVVPGVPDPEVPEKAFRRKFTAEYKLRILQSWPTDVRVPGAWEGFCAKRGCIHRT